MTPVEVLHNAARRYCIDRKAEWSQRYSRLMAEERVRTAGWTYTDEARNTFPRVSVVSAILNQVERFVPADFRSEEECRALLILAGETAESTDWTDNAIEARAVQEERDRFVEFMAARDVQEFAILLVLPFRRVLGTDEHRQLHRVFGSKWGRWYGGAARLPEPPRDVVTLHVAAMGAADSYDSLRRALCDRGITRLLELRENDDGYEEDLALAEFTYDGREGFWTSGDTEWMVYASHESSITFGGAWLIEAMRKCLPEFDRFLYRGWDLSNYDIRKS